VNFVYVRDKSDDRSIWTSVVNDDEYRIDNLNPEDVVLDIGMHTGSFCARAYLAGSRRIYGFEVDTENFRLAQANVASMAQVYNVAVVRSDDRRNDPVYYTGHIPMEHELNTGVGTVFGDATDRQVPTAALDAIIKQIKPVRLIKIDTEGSEYPIIMGSRLIRQVGEIVGEWHLNHSDEIKEQFGFTATLENLMCCLEAEGHTSRFYARDEDMPNPIVGYFRSVNNHLLRADDPWRIGEGRTLVCASE
jgi:FkbM family methyltransferase